MAGEKGEKKEEVLYVGLQSPIELRRVILESTRDAVEMLQNYEKFRAVREEKVKTIAQLQDQIKEMARLINKLKLELPKVDVRIKLHKEQEMIESEKKAAKEAGKPKKKETKAKKEVPKKTRELSELEKLEAELTSIEQKLGKA
jgi:TolA-binding protein